MNTTTGELRTFGDYALRRLHPEDASGVSQLVRQVYGEGYYPPAMYDPSQIVRMNEEGALASVVALDTAREVVGHYALERPPFEVIAEASDAIVLPQHRHHHLLEEMRVLLREEALRLGLVGLVGYPVTNHVFSQQADEHYGAHPCGIALGLWPPTFHNMPESLPQRMSFVIYFKHFHPPDHVVAEATAHQDMLARIYEQFGIRMEVRAAAPAAGAGEVAVEIEPPVQTATIRVRRIGADTAAAVRRARTDLLEKSAVKAIGLELPLDQTGTAEVCRAVEPDGFFFSGLGPAFTGGRDVLLLQCLVEDLDLSLVQIHSPFARDLLTYVGRERERVGR